MRNYSVIKLLLSCLVMTVCAGTAGAQRHFTMTRVKARAKSGADKTSNASAPSRKILPNSASVGKSRLTFDSGETLEVEDFWSDAQSVWFMRSGVGQKIEIRRVRSFQPLTAPALTTEADARPQPIMQAADKPDPKPVSYLIFFAGGAKMKVDSVNESTAGVWYHQGGLTVFVDGSRIKRIERDEPATVATARYGDWLARGWTTGNAGIDDLIRHNGERFGVDPYLVFCVMEQESHFHRGAVSPKGARGLMQLMPSTGARFGVRRFFDPTENIAGGTRYLKELLDRFNGRVDLVLASYNAGEGAVERYGRAVPPFTETRTYVKRISARYGKKPGTTVSDR